MLAFSDVFLVSKSFIYVFNVSNFLEISSIIENVNSLFLSYMYI